MQISCNVFAGTAVVLFDRILENATTSDKCFPILQQGKLQKSFTLYKYLVRYLDLKVKDSRSLWKCSTKETKFNKKGVDKTDHGFKSGLSWFLNN